PSSSTSPRFPYTTLFRSADFQHALAWRLHTRYPDASIRLEYKPFLAERLYLDLWITFRPSEWPSSSSYATRGLSRRKSVGSASRSEEHTPELQSPDHLVC